MISFQQLLDTTRTNSEICCPGFNYWTQTTASTQNEMMVAQQHCCVAQGTQWCRSGHVAQFEVDKLDAGSGGLNTYAPNMKIDPETGNYHFFVGNQINEPPYQCNMSNNAMRFRAEFSRTGERVTSPNSVSLGILCDNSYDRCCCKITRWHCYGVYSDANNALVMDGRNMGMFFPCIFSDPGTWIGWQRTSGSCGCQGRWSFGGGCGCKAEIRVTGCNDFGMRDNHLICDYSGNPNCAICTVNGVGISQCNIKCCSQQLKPWTANYSGIYSACGDLPALSFIGHSSCARDGHCPQSSSSQLCCACCWTPFCGFFISGLNCNFNNCDPCVCQRGFIWETGGINYTADHGKTAIYKYGSRFAHQAYICCQCTSQGYASCNTLPFTKCGCTSSGCCHCAWPDYKMYVIANEYHPQEEYWTVLCCCQTHTCKSVWTLQIPTTWQYYNVNCYGDAVAPNINCFCRWKNCSCLEREFMQTQAIARKTPDVDPNPSSYYVGIVSNRFVCPTQPYGGLTPTLALVCPCCTCSEGGTCPDWHAPHGVVWEQNLPTWDGTTSGGCHCWAGKTWYFPLACFAVDNVCGELIEHYSIKDMEFRGGKIILKPNNDLQFQPACTFCNGNIVQPSVYFCENNCAVTQIFFCDLYKGTKVGSNLSFTKRGTWLVTTPNFNPWYVCCVPNSNCGNCACHYQPAYEGFTVSEFSEDWSTCIGAVGICLSSLIQGSEAVRGCRTGGFCTGAGQNTCQEGFGKSSNYQNAWMRDYEANYDYFTDDLVIAWTVPGSRNHYCIVTNCTTTMWGKRNHGGINLFKIPADIASLCTWACDRLKVIPCNGCCTVCGGTAHDGCFICGWRCALDGGLESITGTTGNGRCTPSGAFLRQHANLACGQSDSLWEQIMFIEPVAPVQACYKTYTMECCQIDPACWLSGCCSDIFQSNNNWTIGTCGFNHMHKLNCSPSFDHGQTWISCIGTCYLEAAWVCCIQCSCYTHRMVCSCPHGGYNWVQGRKNGIFGDTNIHCALTSCRPNEHYYNCHNNRQTSTAFTLGQFYHHPPHPIYICEC